MKNSSSPLDLSACKNNFSHTKVSNLRTTVSSNLIIGLLSATRRMLFVRKRISAVSIFAKYTRIGFDPVSWSSVLKIKPLIYESLQNLHQKPKVNSLLWSIIIIFYQLVQIYSE